MTGNICAEKKSELWSFHKLWRKKEAGGGFFIVLHWPVGSFGGIGQTSFGQLDYRIT
ncbi:MAG: hypothetical protein ACFFFG_02205 [Candidatus Thorarchaeota archaeon]